MWNLKRSDTNELANRNRLTDLENELMVARRKDAGEGGGEIGSLGWTCIHCSI